MTIETAPPPLLALAGLLVVAAGFLAARRISAWAAWEPAGPIALIAAAPVVPRIPLFMGLSADDLLPLLGLGMLFWRLPAPRMTRDWLLLGLLLAVAVATAARIASSLVNGEDLQGTLTMLVQAIARPAVLLGIVSYVAIAAPARVRQPFAALAIAVVGTFEAAFGLLAFIVRLPGDAGIEAARRLTSLYDVCPGRVSGTLGLSPNHLGAVFVLSIPFTLSLAVTGSGWRRWAWTFAAAIQAAALLLTFTRSSILLGAVVAVAYLAYERRFVLLTAFAAVTAVLAFSALSLGCTTGSGGPGLPEEPGSLLGGRFGDGNDRLALWYSAGWIMVDNPIAGVGLGRMAEVITENPDRYRDTPFGAATSSAHNTILLAGAETGVLGGLAVLAVNIGLAVIALQCAWRGRRRDAALLLAAGLAIGAYLAQGMVNNLFSVPATSSVFALVVGAFAGSRRSDGSSSGTDRDEPEVLPSASYTLPPSDASTPSEDL